MLDGLALGVKRPHGQDVFAALQQAPGRELSGPRRSEPLPQAAVHPAFHGQGPAVGLDVQVEDGRFHGGIGRRPDDLHGRGAFPAGHYQGDGGLVVGLLRIAADVVRIDHDLKVVASGPGLPGQAGRAIAADRIADHRRPSQLNGGAAGLFNHGHVDPGRAVGAPVAQRDDQDHGRAGGRRLRRLEADLGGGDGEVGPRRGQSLAAADRPLGLLAAGGDRPDVRPDHARLQPEPGVDHVVAAAQMAGLDLERVARRRAALVELDDPGRDAESIDALRDGVLEAADHDAVHDDVDVVLLIGPPVPGQVEAHLQPGLHEVGPHPASARLEGRVLVAAVSLRVGVDEVDLAVPVGVIADPGDAGGLVRETPAVRRPVSVRVLGGRPGSPIQGLRVEGVRTGLFEPDAGLLLGRRGRRPGRQKNAEELLALFQGQGRLDRDGLVHGPGRERPLDRLEGLVQAGPHGHVQPESFVPPFISSMRFVKYTPPVTRSVSPSPSLSRR